MSRKTAQGLLSSYVDPPNIANTNVLAYIAPPQSPILLEFSHKYRELLKRNFY